MSLEAAKVHGSSNQRHSMIVRLLCTLTALSSVVLADVEFTSPAAGLSVSGTTLDVEWSDGPDAPALSSLTTYDLFLCAGGNSDGQFIPLTALKNAGLYADGNSVSVPFTPGLGEDVENAYFLKMMSTATTGIVINYSKRFSLPAMTGSFPPAVKAGLKTVTGTDGPPTQNQIAQPAGGSNPVAGDYGVPYLSQSGATRFAPMPPVPSSKITVKNTKRLVPTFPYSMFLSNQGTPNAQTTLTQEQTFSVQSREPDISPAPMPFDSDMQKFLRRWVDDDEE